MLSGFETRREDVSESLLDENAFEFPEDTPALAERTDYDSLAEEALAKESYDYEYEYDDYEYDICIEETSCVELGQCSEEGLFG